MRKQIKKSKTKDKEDPYVKRRYSILASILSLSTYELSKIASFLSKRLNMKKHTVYVHLDQLLKEERISKKEKNGKTFILIKDETKKEIYERALMVFDDETKSVLYEFIDQKSLKDENILLFFKNTIPKLARFISDLLEETLPKIVIPKEFSNNLMENLLKFYSNEYISSQLF
ncbi:MAG: hypothetical protein ACFFHD_06625 [Promethearchaeota archaeon]